ncbi:MAG TPA: glycosyltransferase, partial [Calditrichia bacterium]|nr:glycosyltransferase [Calditrichia bacterium]
RQGEASRQQLKALLKEEGQTFHRLMGEIAGRNAGPFKGEVPTPVSTPPPPERTDLLKVDMSVVVAVRDRSGYRVRNFLDSLRHQKGIADEPEIILVDSASASDHHHSLRHLAQTFRATLIRLEEPHPWNKPLALNVGIKAANRANVLLTDIDMIFEDNFIATAQKYLDAHQGRVVLHCQSRDLPPRAVNEDTPVLEIFEELKQQSRRHTRLGNGACFATRREWLHRVGGLDEAYTRWGAMDRDISLRAEWDGLPIVWMEETAFLHQWHVGKQQLWRADAGLRRIWDDNHHRLEQFRRAADSGKHLPDQIRRNPQGWGMAPATTCIKNGEVRHSLPAAKTDAKIPVAPPQIFAPAALAPEPEAPFSGTVALAFNACPGDSDILEYIIPHVVKQCAYPFVQKLLFSDRSAPVGKYAGTRRFEEEKYDQVLARLLEEGHLDAVRECRDLAPAVRPFLAGDFENKSHVGSPTLSYLASMFLPEADYILRLDSDILFYRRPDFDWVAEGIRLMEADPGILFFMATPGPFSPQVRQMRSFRGGVSHSGGYFHYSSVTTRYFLFKKSRLEHYCRRFLSPGARRLEIALGNLCAVQNLRRVCMYSPDVWHLHSNAAHWSARSPAALDKLITCVEQNQVPAGQLGEYDLTGGWKNALMMGA